MSIPTLLSAFGLCWFTSLPVAGPDAKSLADVYVNAVGDLNDAHVRKPVARSEAELAGKMPKKALDAFEALFTIKAGDALEQLARCGEAALDLDRIFDFERVRAQLGPQQAAALGLAISRPRFLMRGLDGVEPEGLKAVADALDLALDAYDETFGFAEWSKVPGKKLRIRVHLVPKIVRSPHFAPQFPWHSEIDFPVLGAATFQSPSPDGKMFLFGLCHELGHVIAMWGDANEEEDRHAWADFTGYVVLDRLSARKNEPALRGLRDGQWYSLEKTRKRLSDAGAKAGRKAYDDVLQLFVELNDLVGPRAMGEAINALDAEDKRLRINRVRYYDLDAFVKALIVTGAGKKKAKELRALLG